MVQGRGEKYEAILTSSLLLEHENNQCIVLTGGGGRNLEDEILAFLQNFSYIFLASIQSPMGGSHQTAIVQSSEPQVLKDSVKPK